MLYNGIKVTGVCLSLCLNGWNRLKMLDKIDCKDENTYKNTNTKTNINNNTNCNNKKTKKKKENSVQMCKDGECFFIFAVFF